MYSMQKTSNARGFQWSNIYANFTSSAALRCTKEPLYKMKKQIINYKDIRLNKQQERKKAYLSKRQVFCILFVI